MRDKNHQRSWWGRVSKLQKMKRAVDAWDGIPCRPIAIELAEVIRMLITHIQLAHLFAHTTYTHPGLFIENYLVRCTSMSLGMQ